MLRGKTKEGKQTESNGRDSPLYTVVSKDDYDKVIFERRQNKVKEVAYEHLGEKHPEQRDQQVQRPWVVLHLTSSANPKEASVAGGE